MQNETLLTLPNEIFQEIIKRVYPGTTRYSLRYDPPFFMPPFEEDIVRGCPLDHLGPPTPMLRLRLVCRWFNDAVSPLFYHTVVIGYPTKDSDFVEYLESLANGMHTSLSCAKSVTILEVCLRSYIVCSKSEEHKKLKIEKLKSLLPLAIKNFNRATRVK
ncbi:hypothetical protein BDQ17DRAFT_1433406 [Cyathus striatus]|nr:hypothetical protein BDQ17DRAFT_1433406 [Cyathus striatus]